MFSSGEVVTCLYWNCRNVPRMELWLTLIFILRRDEQGTVKPSANSLCLSSLLQSEWTLSDMNLMAQSYFWCHFRRPLVLSCAILLAVTASYPPSSIKLATEVGVQWTSYYTAISFMPHVSQAPGQCEAWVISLDAATHKW